MSQKTRWLNAYWRWFLAAIDRRDYETALKLSRIMERIKRQ